MPWRTGAHGALLRLAHRATELHPGGELLGHALGDQLSVDLGVLDLEDVQLDLLAGQLLQLAADALRLGAVAADDDARTGGVDVDPDPVPGALDLDAGDAGALEVLGQHPADLDVLADVGAVQLVGVPTALVVGGDAEAEAVRVDLLTHAQASWLFVLRARLDDDGDVAGPLEDPAGAALGPRTDPAHGHALVDERLRDVQVGRACRLSVCSALATALASTL